MVTKMKTMISTSINSKIFSFLPSWKKHCFKGVSLIVLSFALTGCNDLTDDAEEKIDQASLNAGADKAKIATDIDFIQSAEGGSGSGAVSYVSSDPSVATVDKDTGRITMLTAGSTTITVTRAGDVKFKEASDSYLLRVNKAEQEVFTIDMDKINNFTAGVESIPPAKGGSGLGDITYVSSNPQVATIDRNTGKVTRLSVGTTTITATKAGDIRFNDTIATLILELNKVDQAAFNIGANRNILTIMNDDYSTVLSLTKSGLTTVTVTAVDAVGNKITENYSIDVSAAERPIIRPIFEVTK